MGKLQKDKEHHTQESQEVSPFPAGDQKVERNRQDSIIKDIHTKSNALERSKKSLEGLNMFNGANLTINSDMDQDT